jgi:septal ring factor EnvC (AmiA/AmiB activator)
MTRAALKELMAWDLFKWIVLALLTANCLLIAGLYSGNRSDVAELKQDRNTYAKEIADTRAEVGKEISDTRAGLDQAISAIKADVRDVRAEAAKTNAKLDALIDQSRKPSEKPHR